MRSALVVPLNPVPNDLPCLLERPKDMLPDTLFFQTAKEPLDDSILLRRIRRDEFLLQPIVPTGLPKAPTLGNEAVVTPEDRRCDWAQRAEPLQARHFHRPLRLLRATAERKRVAHNFPIMAINHRREMRPAILPTGNMRHIHGPPFVTPAGPTHPPVDSRPWGDRPADGPTTASASTPGPPPSCSRVVRSARAAAPRDADTQT